jgi:hypothetical protein
MAEVDAADRPVSADLCQVHGAFGSSIVVARFAGRAQEAAFPPPGDARLLAAERAGFPVEEGTETRPFACGTGEAADLVCLSGWRYSHLGCEMDRRVRQSLCADGSADISLLDLLKNRSTI